MTIRYEGGAGSSWDHIQLFSFIKGEFKQIFDAPENIKFIPKNEGYYDIETTPKGGQPVLYKFNGSEYVQQ
jgi:hypothetical protein